MRIAFPIIVLLTVSSCVFGPLATSKRAMKMLGKGDTLKTQALIHKALEKDSLLPAALYARSKFLVSQNNYKFYDSAYYYVLHAQSIYDTLDTRAKEQHIKQQFDSVKFQQTKLTIDSLAFEHTQQVNTEAEYNLFLTKYPTAKQVLLAKSKRNALAFASAKAKNTYQGYQAFIEQYPHAVQVPEAKRRYEKLYFDKSTADGKVTSYIRFLEKNPDTPYRREAEQKIFEVVTSEHSVGGYELFIKKYPNSFLRKKAINYAYHVALEKNEQLPGYLLSDSLRQVSALSGYGLIPILEGHEFGFMDTAGHVAIKPQFKAIAKKYNCQTTYDDFLRVDNHLEGRNGAVISKKRFDEVKDLGYGLLKAKSGNKWGVLHKDGDVLTETKYDQVKLIGGTILALGLGQHWSLKTVSGRLLVADRFDDIYEQGGFIVFEKNDVFEIKTVGQVMRAVDNNPGKFEFAYTDFELLPDGNLWLQSASKEMIVDKGFNQVVAGGRQQIKFLATGFIIHHGRETTFFDENYNPALTNLRSVENNESWITGKKDTLSLALNLEANKLLTFTSDSVQLFGQHFLVVKYPDSTSLFFANGSRLVLKAPAAFSMLSNADASYLSVMGKKQRLYNATGEQILETDPKPLTPLGEEYLLFEERGKKGVISTSTGKTVLKPMYEAIGNYARGSISLLKDHKFGLFNERLHVMIPTQYDKNIVPYNDSTFIVSIENEQFLLTSDNEKLNEAGFDEIHYWNDTTAFVKEEGVWGLFNLKTRKEGPVRFRSYKEHQLKSGERVAIILGETGYGVLSNSQGELIGPTFNDILLIETAREAVYFAEKHIKEAEFYVVIYYDDHGNILRKQAFEPDEYFKIYCE